MNDDIENKIVGLKGEITYLRQKCSLYQSCIDGIKKSVDGKANKSDAELDILISIETLENTIKRYYKSKRRYLAKHGVEEPSRSGRNKVGYKLDRHHYEKLLKAQAAYHKLLEMYYDKWREYSELIQYDAK
jgi:hypothetical protein